MSSCAYHSPRFSEDAAWLPQWLQPHRQPTVGEIRRDGAGASPPCEGCVFIVDPAQEHHSFQNVTANTGDYDGFCLRLSGDEETPVSSTPTSREVLPFSLHLSSESGAQLSSAQAIYSPQILNSGTHRVPLEGSYVDYQAIEISDVPQHHLESKVIKDDKLLEECRVASMDITKPLGARRHQLSGGKVDVQKLRNADANDAVELSIAASEAMIIAEMILKDCQSDKLTAAALEAALRVKEARKQCFLEEIEHNCGFSENDLDESDWLAELDEVEMLDVFQDVGLYPVQNSYSSHGHNTSDLKQLVSQPGCAPCDEEVHILDICSPDELNKKRHSEDPYIDDHVSESLVNNNSACMLLNESTPGCYSVKQTALDKATAHSRNKETVLEIPTQNNGAFAGSFMPPVRSQNIPKEAGRIIAQTNFYRRTRENVYSFISESMDSVNECSPAPGPMSTDMVASSRASFHKTDCEENQGAELCYQVACSSLSLEDPLCSFVPCSISCNEVSTSQAPECKQSNGEENELIYPEESLKKDLKVIADPSSLSLAQAPESSPGRRRIYSSLRSFSTGAPISNIFGGSAIQNDDHVAVCQKKCTPIILNKKIQRVQAYNKFIENNFETGSLKKNPLVQKSSCSHGNNEHQSREQHIPSKQRPTYLNVGKQDLKRKGTELLNAKVSARQTKSRRTKYRLSWSESRITDMLEPMECINNKEAIFHGLIFLLTGFQSRKEKEVESLIRKFGGCVLSKVPPYLFDKGRKLAEPSRLKLPMVISPKKVSTAKFLFGCATNSLILNPDWIFDSLQAGSLLPSGKYSIRQSHAVKQSSTLDQSLHLRNNKLVFHGVGFLIHGKISFCSKFSNIIKHGGGQVFVSLQELIQSLKDKSSSHGIILVANEASASRHLSHCGLEHDIKTAPASWIIGSLFSGKLNPLKKDRCASFRQIKMPSFQHQRAFEMSQEI